MRQKCRRFVQARLHFSRTAGFTEQFSKLTINPAFAFILKIPGPPRIHDQIPSPSISKLCVVAERVADGLQIKTATYAGNIWPSFLGFVLVLFRQLYIQQRRQHSDGIF
jgi:hypothetical protein